MYKLLVLLVISIFLIACSDDESESKTMPETMAAPASESAPMAKDSSAADEPTTPKTWWEQYNSG